MTCRMRMGPNHSSIPLLVRLRLASVPSPQNLPMMSRTSIGSERSLTVTDASDRRTDRTFLEGGSTGRDGNYNERGRVVRAEVSGEGVKGKVGVRQTFIH